MIQTVNSNKTTNDDTELLDILYVYVSGQLFRQFSIQCMRAVVSRLSCTASLKHIIAEQILPHYILTIWKHTAHTLLK